MQANLKILITSNIYCINGATQGRKPQPFCTSVYKRLFCWNIIDGHYTSLKGWLSQYPNWRCIDLLYLFCCFSQRKPRSIEICRNHCVTQWHNASLNETEVLIKKQMLPEAIVMKAIYFFWCWNKPVPAQFHFTSKETETLFHPSAMQNIFDFSWSSLPI